ncbi:hypothetical protein G6F42_028779 [Rhizopus arrhizus]|nr:hypothetical protein G6F42_028779 [Rhizopus arrhizus]
MSACPICDSASNNRTTNATDDSHKTKQSHLHIAIALWSEYKTGDGYNRCKHGKIDTKHKDQQQIVSALEHHLDTLSECDTAHFSAFSGWHFRARGQE